MTPRIIAVGLMIGVLGFFAILALGAYERKSLDCSTLPSFHPTLERNDTLFFAPHVHCYLRPGQTP